MKKHYVLILSSVVLSSLAFASNATMTSQPQSTMTYELTSDMNVTSNQALVRVTLNATALNSKDQQQIKTSAIAKLQGILAQSNWHVTLLNVSNAQSGAENITMMMEARLSSKEIATLREKLKNNNSDNSRFKVEVLNYDPSAKVLQSAKESLMIKTYQQVQDYVKQFNEKTANHYHIKDVSYCFAEEKPQFKARAIQTYSMATNANGGSGQASESLKVAKKIELFANVTLAQTVNTEVKQPPQKSTDKAMTGQMNMLPPKYLEVKGYKQCFLTKDQGTWQSWCMPSVKPPACSDQAWQELLALKASGQLNAPECDHS